MNDPSQPTPPAVDTSIDAGDRARSVDPSRRRLVRSGLASSVVLGSLVSKPVLGAEYICTVSGHASGNASAHLTDDAVCDVGENVVYWRDNAWPAGFVKGSLPVADATAKTCSFADGQGTLFNGLTIDGQTLADTFYYRTGANGCGVRLRGVSPGAALLSRKASLYQVLDQGNTQEIYRLGRATVVSLLNAAHLGTAYPVSSARVIEMFNAVKDGGTYHVEGANVSLTRLGVIEYFESLYS